MPVPLGYACACVLMRGSRASVRGCVCARACAWMTTIVLGGTDSMLWIESIFQAAMNIRNNSF